MPPAPDPLAALASHVMHCDCDIQGVGGAPRNHTDPACVELQNELAAYVRDLEAALRAADHALEGSQQFMLSIVAALGLPASDVPAATRALMFEVAHTLARVRALAPPERSRVAAPAEDAREATGA